MENYRGNKSGVRDFSGIVDGFGRPIPAAFSFLRQGWDTTTLALQKQ
jgi:hypothetical protein